MAIRLGDQIPIQVQLFDGATGKFPRAVVRDAAGATISGSPFSLTHIALGQYSNAAAVMPNTKFVTVQIAIYDDAGFTTLSPDHEITLDQFNLDESLAAAGYTAPSNADIAAIKVKTDQLAFTSSRVDAVISATQENTIVDKVWDELLADHLTPATMGANMNLVDDTLTAVNGLSASDAEHQLLVPSTITLPVTGSDLFRFYFRGMVAGVPANPAVGPEIEITDGAGGVLIAYTAMTNEATGLFYYDWTVNSTDPAEQFIVKVRHKDAIPDPYTTLVATGSRASTQADIAAVYFQTTAIKAKTDNLPADPADNSEILDAIDAIPTVTPPTVGQIADAVWDAATSAHVVAGSFGLEVQSGGSVSVELKPLPDLVGVLKDGTDVLVGVLADDDDDERIVGIINDTEDL